MNLRKDCMVYAIDIVHAIPQYDLLQGKSFRYGGEYWIENKL